MIETLEKMSGKTHKTFTDSKSVTRDLSKLTMQNEGKVSYTMTTKETPVISYNDMAFISRCNSIVFRAGDSPIWNRNETILPMSWRLFSNTITQPGKEYSLQTIPTLSSALDFDIRQNQPDFVKMLDKRMAQACKAQAAMDMYKDAYNYTDAELAKLDIDAYSDEIMALIGAMLNDSVGKGLSDVETNDDDESEYIDATDWDDTYVPDYAEDIDDIESYGMFDEGSVEDNDDVRTEVAKYQARRDEADRKIYAGGYISRSMLVNANGSVRTHSFDRDFSEVFANNMGEMLKDTNYFEDRNGDLYGVDGKAYIVKNDNSAIIAKINAAAKDDDSKVYAESEIEQRDLSEFTTYTVTDDFYKFLASLNSWSFANGVFESEMRRKMM